MATDLMIGIDVGTTAVKAGLLDGHGLELASFRGVCATQHPRSAFVEQNPDDWVELIVQALAHIVATGQANRVAAIGLCSQVNTHVFVDATGTPLMPAILWQDTRASAEARELEARITPAQKLAWWGAPIPIDASHPLARMLWVARNRADIWEKTRWVLLPKDYCIFKLTGQIRADPLSNFGLVDTSLCYIDPLLALVAGASDRVAPLGGITDVVGELVLPGPLLGRPVVLGTMDAWTGLVGAGGATQGAAVYLSGTSEILGITATHITPTPGVIVFAKNAGIRIHAGPTQSGGAALQWFCDMTRQTPQDIANLATFSDRSKPAPIFLPHLQGERAPLWNADLRAAFLCMDAQTTQADLARAVYEGVAFSARWVLDALQMSAGLVPDTLSCGGGGFASDLWNQIRADVLGRTLRRLAVKDPGIVGAAAIAAVGIGTHATLASASQHFARFDATYHPNAARHAALSDLYEIFREATLANVTINAKYLALARAAPFLP